MSSETRDTLTNLFLVQKSRLGLKQKDFWNDLVEAGLTINYSTFSSWVRSALSDATPREAAKKRGQQPKLDKEQRGIMAGFVLHSNATRQEVRLSDYIAAAHSMFDVELSKSTAQRYLVDDGFSSQRVRLKSQIYSMSTESLQTEALRWVDKQRTVGVFDRPLSRIASIDFTFTGHGRDTRQTYAMRGNSSNTVNCNRSSFTNCIVTCLWADGKNRTPPMLFTFNQKFRLDRPPTATRQAQVKHLRNCMSRYHIKKERIVYVGKPKSETRTYVTEKSELIRKFFAHYAIADDCVIFSDNGNSFAEHGQSVLEDLGFQQHLYYPACVHQYLSPNDNNVHGSAKKAWRAARRSFEDDVDSCLHLLQLLDRSTTNNSKLFFQTNLLSLTKSTVERLVTGNTIDSKFAVKSLNAFKKSQGLDCVGDQSDIPVALRSLLNGSYYASTSEEKD